jgi:molybdenum cofactor biosynthesis protein B
MSHEKHRQSAPGKLGFYVITVSSSRYAKKIKGEEFEDESGNVAGKIIDEHKYSLVGREIVSDNAELIKSAFNRSMVLKDVDVILFTGGTGLSPNDITIETIRPFFDKEIEGFGEMLRVLSFKKIGAAAILTRATGGVVNDRLVLCLPGSPNAVRTALESFISELPHAVYIARGRKNSA